MNRILVTGGAGFVGRHLVGHLLVEGASSVRILDSLSPQIHGHLPNEIGWLRNERVEFVRGSVINRAEVETSLEDVTHVVHLAAETGTGQSMYEIAKYNQVNSQGTAILLDVLANTLRGRVKRLVLASSRAVYGEGAYVCEGCDGGAERLFPQARTAEQLRCHQWELLCSRCGNPLKATASLESDPVRPASIYAATKCAQEDLVRVVCESLGIEYAILRFQNVYGEGQSLGNPYTGILSVFSTRIRKNLPVAAFEDGLESRDFVHVEDVARVIGRCLVSTQRINQVINVGSGRPISVIEIAKRLTEAFGASPNVAISSEYRIGDIRHNYADLSRLKAVLEYEPMVTLEEGLRRFARWVLTRPLPEDLLGKANAELRARKLMG